MLALRARDAPVRDDVRADGDARTAPTTATASSRSRPRSRSRGTRRWARPSRSPRRAGSERRKYVQQTGAGLQPIDVAPANGALDRVDAAGGAGVRRRGRRRPRDGGRRASLPGDAHRDAPAAGRLDRAADAGRAGGRRRGDRAGGSRLRARSTTSRGRGAENLYIAWHDGGRARACPHVHPLGRGRGGSGDRLGRGAAVRVPRGARPRSAESRSSRASRSRRPSRLLAEMEGDRPRVSGGVVTADRGDGVAVTAARPSSTSTAR